MTRRIVVPAILTAIVMFAVGYASGQIFNSIFPSLNDEYQNVDVFRAWSDPGMRWYFFHPLALGLALAWIWIKIRGSFDGTSAFNIGAKFGLFYWFLSISGMIITYSTFQISALMVLSWTVGTFFEAIAAGWLLARLNPPGE